MYVFFFFFQNEWIDKFEEALKFNQLKKKKNLAPQPPTHQVRNANISRSTTKTSLAKSEATISPTPTVIDSKVVNIRYAPEWMVSAQEEIQTLIAQRHFEEALAMITKCQEYFAKDKSFHNASEIIQKVVTVTHGMKMPLSILTVDKFSGETTRK